MKKIKKMMPVKFNANFIPNPPRNQNLMFNFSSGLKFIMEKAWT